MKNDRYIFWLLRAVGMFAAFWYFFWAVINEMIVWNKPQPSTINLILFAVAVIVATAPNFAEKQATQKHAKPKKTKLQQLQDQIMNAKTKKQKEKAIQKLTDHLKEKGEKK